MAAVRVLIPAMNLECCCLGAPLTPFVFTQLDLRVFVRARCACRYARRLAMGFVQGFKLVSDDALELSVPTHFRMLVISRCCLCKKVQTLDAAPLGLGRCSDDDSWCFEYLMTCIFHVVSLDLHHSKDEKRS